MSDLDEAPALIATWLQALPDADAPCGPDLEYDNDFLALTQAAAGKPESQFGAAEAPDWRGAQEMAEALFGRSRDLRVAITWLRSSLALHGYAAFGDGLRLINGLLEQHWDHVHPLPDPDDGDLYGRVNALTVLRENVGLLAELRDARITDDRAIGLLKVRDVELVLGLSTAIAGHTDYGKDRLEQMVAAALAKMPALRARCLDAVEQVQRLIALSGEKLGSDAPDLRPLLVIAKGVAATLPPEAVAADEAAGGDADGEAGAGGGAVSRRGLSGAVTSREEAIRAIDLVCEYLERAEPTNPAPLFLRRARQLISHNFLQLMKVLAPDALAEVARVVGIDPDTVEDPAGP